MSNRLQAYSHLATQALRTGWYAALYRLTSQKVQGAGAEGPKIELTRPVPSTRALLQDVLKLQARDADNIRLGIYPQPKDGDGSLSEHFDAVRRMFADLPDANERRSQGRGHDAASLPEAEGLPDYYTQNFHFQSGGWLTEDSADRYDTQVEVLFKGTANAMRRMALPELHEHFRGRDQRTLRLTDVGCGTGRFLDFVKQTWPRLPVTGIDLSDAYVRHARHHLRRWSRVSTLVAKAESLPLADASQDAVTSVFMMHELPPQIRREMIGECARVLKPGGRLVIVDSLQRRDVPDYAGLLERFPQNYHEPYFESYLDEDFAAIAKNVALTHVRDEPAFVSKVMVFDKP